MNSLSHDELKQDVAMQDVLAELERRQAGAVSQEASDVWRHAAQLCGNGWPMSRALWQLQYHATRVRDVPAPVKSATYREAMELLMELSGEEPGLEVVRDHEHDAPADDEPFVLVPT